MKKFTRYMLVIAMSIVAMLGIPVIFPSKGNPYKGKSVRDKSSREIRE